MASFGTGGEKSDIGRWCVHAIFNSPWMPKTSEHVRNEAAEIINSIALMFNRWVRGYISIVLIETALYTVLFSAFSVPNAFPLAFAAGMTIFLPFIGPLASFALTVAVCLCFCETHLIITLIGVCLSLPADQRSSGTAFPLSDAGRRRNRTDDAGDDYRRSSRRASRRHNGHDSFGPRRGGFKIPDPEDLQNPDLNLQTATDGFRTKNSKKTSYPFDFSESSAILHSILKRRRSSTG